MIVLQLISIEQLFMSQKRLPKGFNTFSKLVNHSFDRVLEIFYISYHTILFKFHSMSYISNNVHDLWRDFETLDFKCERQ